MVCSGLEILLHGNRVAMALIKSINVAVMLAVCSYTYGIALTLVLWICI